jgi:hypothetical protein
MNSIAGATKYLLSNATSVESTDSQVMSSFDSTGFTVGTEDDTNGSTKTFVAWNWKAGNATLGTGDFTQGSIASTCSRNVDAGFSIVSYTGNLTSGANVGHGLSKAPEMIIVRNRTLAGEPWRVYHASNTSAPETDYLALNTTAVTADSAAMWNDTAPSATLFTLGLDASTNGDEATIAYCFHSVDGYSKVGSYTGNGSADGTFVYTGFRPAYVMIKSTTLTEEWMLLDSARDTYNMGGRFLSANTSPGEVTSLRCDFLSNGLKWYTTHDNTNNNGASYIFLCFAEHPFKHTNAR